MHNQSLPDQSLLELYTPVSSGDVLYNSDPRQFTCSVAPEGIYNIFIEASYVLELTGIPQGIPIVDPFVSFPGQQNVWDGISFPGQFLEQTSGCLWIQ